MKKFAEGTVVSVAKSRTEIEDLLARYGADGFAYAIDQSKAAIMFSVLETRVRFVLPLPSKMDPAFTHKKSRYSWGSPVKLTDAQAFALWDQELRRLWRSLALVIKAKLEAVRSGIVTFESEFLAHIVMPNGRTVGEDIAPTLLEMRESGNQIPLLPGGFN